MNKDNQYLFFFVTNILVLLMLARTPLDSDAWWHLRVGEDTVMRQSVPVTDSLSFTKSGEAWVNHSWLFRVLLYLAYRYFGYYGIAGFVCLAAAICFSLLHAQLEGRRAINAFLVVLAAIICSPVWTPRPQILSITLLAGLSYLIRRYDEGKGVPFWTFVPLFILWSNLHGGYFIGFVLIACYLSGRFVDSIFQNRRMTRKELSMLIWSGIAWVCAIINPNGVKMWTTPFETLEASGNVIAEWASPNFHDVIPQLVLLLILMMFAAACLGKRRPSGFDIVAVVVFSYLAVVSERNFGLFAIVAAPAFSRQLNGLIDEMIERRKPAQENAAATQPKPRLREIALPSIMRPVNLAIVGILFFCALAKFAYVAHPAVIASAERDGYPQNATRWMADHDPPGNLFNDYNWGGYLTWRLRDYPVFIDGRADLYGAEFIAEYVKIASAKAGWQELLDKWKIRTVLISPTWELAGALKDSGDWSLRYEDDHAVVFSR